MADPLSITAGVVALLTAVTKVTAELKGFHDGARLINETVADLENDVAGMQRVLESMRDTFATITAVEGTGHIASLWTNVAQAISDGKTMLERLHAQIQDIGRDKSFLSDYRKQLRLERAEVRITALRINVQSFRDCLQLSLQSIVLWNQVSYQTSSDQVLPSLNRLHASVRRIAQDLNKRIEALQSAEQSNTQKQDLNEINNLKACVRSAASIITSASTVMGSQHGQDAQASNFGDCLSESENIAMRRWIETRTVHEYDDMQAIEPPQSVADVPAADESGGEGSGSDSEVESEITELLLASGKEKMSSGDLSAAERTLQNCLKRLHSHPRKHDTTHSTRILDTLDCLRNIYEQKQEWKKAQSMLSQRITLVSNQGNSGSSQLLSDTLMLAKLLQATNDSQEAQLQARRALKGFKRLQHTDGVRECLLLLISLCSSDDDEDDKEAYTVMLASLDHHVEAATLDLGLHSPAPPMNHASESTAALAPGAVDTGNSADIDGPDSSTSPEASRTESIHQTQEVALKQRSTIKHDSEQLNSSQRSFPRSQTSPEDPGASTPVDENYAVGPSHDVMYNLSTSIFLDVTNEERPVKSTVARQIAEDARHVASVSFEQDTLASSPTRELGRTTKYDQLEWHAMFSGLDARGLDAVEDDVHDSRDGANVDQAYPVYPSPSPGVDDDPRPRDSQSLHADHSLQPSISANTLARESSDPSDLALLKLWMPSTEGESLSAGLRSASSSVDSPAVDCDQSDNRSTTPSETQLSVISSRFEYTTTTPSATTADEGNTSGWSQKRETSGQRLSVFLREQSNMKGYSQRIADRAEALPASERNSSQHLPPADRHTRRGATSDMDVENSPDITSTHEEASVLNKIEAELLAGRSAEAESVTTKSASRVVRPFKLPIVGDVARPGRTSQEPIDQQAKSAQAPESCSPAPQDAEVDDHDSVRVVVGVAGSNAGTEPAPVHAAGPIASQVALELSLNNASTTNVPYRHPNATSSRMPSKKSAITILDANALAKLSGTSSSTSTGAGIKRNLVIVGDGLSGKTYLLKVLATGKYPNRDIVSPLDTNKVDLEVDGKHVELVLWDTAGQEDYDRLRPISYPSANVVLICFAIDCPDSLHNIPEKWIHEILYYCRGLPIILIGTKKDLRYDPKTIEDLRKFNMKPTTWEEGESLRKKIGARKYFEVSAKTNEGVMEMFEYATRSALLASSSSERGETKDKKCTIL